MSDIPSVSVNETESSTTVDKNDNSTQQKTGFSWMAFFFGGYYYAGYGNLKKAMIFIAISILIPMSGLIVNIYAGFKARQDLPIGQQEFNWKQSLGLLAISIVISSLYMSMLTATTLPSCESTEAEETIAEIVKENWNLELVAIDSIEELGFNEKREIRACSGTLVSTSESYDFKYSIKWQNNKKEIYFVEVQMQ